MVVIFAADKLDSEKFDFRSSQGNFLIGSENTWHGGIHIEGKDVGIQAIADGRIIAYRFEKGYKKLEKNEGEGEGKKYEYSNCFIIIQHDLELAKVVVKNKGKANESSEKKVEYITFYSLYNHLLPLDFFGSKEPPKFMSKKAYKVSKNESFPSNVKTGLNARILKSGINEIKTGKSGVKLVIPFGAKVTKDLDTEGNPIMVGNYAKVIYHKDGGNYSGCHFHD